MRKVCARCGARDAQEKIEVSVKIRGLTYSTSVPATMCETCLVVKADPNELTAFRVGIAMRAVRHGRLTGRGLAFCRRAAQISPDGLAKRLNISAACLLGLEEKGFSVPAEIHGYVARRVRRVFKALKFVPRIALEEEACSNIGVMDV